VVFLFFFQAEDGIRDFHVTGLQTCALPIWRPVRTRHRTARSQPGPAAVLEARRPLRRARHGAARAVQRPHGLVLPGAAARYGAGRRPAAARRAPVPGLAAAAAQPPAVRPRAGARSAGAGAGTAAGGLVAQADRAPPAAGRRGGLGPARRRTRAGLTPAQTLGVRWLSHTPKDTRRWPPSPTNSPRSCRAHRSGRLHSSWASTPRRPRPRSAPRCRG